MVALAAILGIFSFSDAASACSVKPVQAPRACCAARPMPDCGCCGEGQALPVSSPGHRSDAAVASHLGNSFRASTPSCECRASEPAAPSERPASRTSTERTDSDTGESLAAFAPDLRPARAPAALICPNQSPPKTPLYLRTSRLLI